MDENEKPFNPNFATEISDEQVADIFDYHKWDEDKIAAGKEVREALGRAYQVIVWRVPPCPTRTVALRKITEARMDANSAITHGKY
jgi:hypothetical protein